MSLTLLQAPAAEPIALADARLQCRIDDTVLDPLLTLYIAAARSQAERRTRRRLITQRWRQTLDAFPSGDDIKLLATPVQRIEQVTYRDSTAEVQTLASTQYLLDAAVSPGYLLPAYGTSWPATHDSPNAVNIDFDCGYGSTGSSVPPDILLWMLMVISFCVEHPEAFSLSGRSAAIPNHFHDELIARYIVRGKGYGP